MNSREDKKEFGQQADLLVAFLAGVFFWMAVEMAVKL